MAQDDSSQKNTTKEPTESQPASDKEAKLTAQQVHDEAVDFGISFDTQDQQKGVDSSSGKNDKTKLSDTDINDTEEGGVIFEPAKKPADTSADTLTKSAFQKKAEGAKKTEIDLDADGAEIKPAQEQATDIPKNTEQTYDPNAVVELSRSQANESAGTENTEPPKKSVETTHQNNAPEGPPNSQPTDTTRTYSNADDFENIPLPNQERNDKTHVPDPLFASRVLEQEEAPMKPSTPKKETPEQPPEQESTADTPGVNTHPPKDIPIVRTYKSDVAQALKDNKTSQVQMVLAEEQKKQKQKEEQKPSSKRNLPLLIGSIVFGFVGLLALAGGAYFFIIGQQNRPDPAETVETNALIFTEKEKGIDITDKSPGAIQNAVGVELSELDIRLDFVEYVYFTERVDASDKPKIEKETVKTLVGSSRFFELLESRMPDTLSRALNKNFMYGIHSFNGNQPFIILKTNFFENAFAGMLNWEPFMAREILPLFNIPIADEIRNKEFTDIVIKNRDLRALLNANEDIILLYTFFDRETIIITAAEETLEEVITRLQRPN